MIARPFGYWSELARECDAIIRANLFDKKWYLKHNWDVRDSQTVPLTHYILHGGFEGRSPNPYFDSAWYLETYEGVRDAGINPLVHYALYGANDLLSCGPKFNTEAYIKENPDIASTNINPLGHYIKYGRKEGRKTSYRYFVRPQAPSWEAFEELVEKVSYDMPDSSVSPLVDVVVPVYRGYDDTLACIYSIRKAKVVTPYELTVINDCSPEPILSEALVRLADMGLCTLLVNSENRGYVATANQAMKLHRDRDVLLLNSDTQVYNNWLDRLRNHALKEQVATVTPLSNNATICSYPSFDKENSEALEISYRSLDRLCATVNGGQMVNLPTGVGFCMYIRRPAINAIGFFDEGVFGRGYGEENDYCMRLIKAGWQNSFALDVFVRHTGEISFADKAKEQKARGLRAVLDKHPRYLKKVKEHCILNPGAQARRRIDAARLREHVGIRTILFVSHTWGGGIEQHVKAEAARLSVEGIGVVLLTPTDRHGEHTVLNAIDKLNLPNLEGLNLATDFKAIVEILGILSVEAIHVHSFAGWPFKALHAIPELAVQIGVPYDFTIHDYMPVCPQINLIDRSGIYCGEPGLAQCRKCLKYMTDMPRRIHPDIGKQAATINVLEWRSGYHSFMKGARNVIAPSTDTARRIERYFPDLHIEIRPHIDYFIAQELSLSVSYQGDMVRVAVIGGIGPRKGLDILMACAKDAIVRKLPLEFVVVGYTSKRSFESLKNVTVTGCYLDEYVFDILSRQRCHMVFLPSVWPETYSYTLSIAMAAKMPCAVFNLGAPSERLQSMNKGLILPIGIMNDSSSINDALLGFVMSSSGSEKLLNKSRS